VELESVISSISKKLIDIDLDIRNNFAGRFFEIGLIDVFQPEFSRVKGVLMYLDNSKSFKDLMVEHINNFKPVYLTCAEFIILTSQSDQEIFEYYNDLYWGSSEKPILGVKYLLEAIL
jgi:hypothetical protein